MIKQIWKDPVWSKVIASGLVVLFGSLYLTISERWSWLVAQVSPLWIFIKGHLLEMIIIVLIILLLVSWRKIRQLSSRSKATAKARDSAVIWLTSLQGEEAQKYSFLAWFPVRETLHTEPYHLPGVVRGYGDVSFDGIRVIVNLFEKGVLRKKNINLTEYVLEIDQKCYDYLEKILIDGAKSENPEDQKNYEKLKTYLRGVPFVRQFPQAIL